MRLARSQASTIPVMSVSAEVQPLPHLPSTRQGESSSSLGHHDEVAYATLGLFRKLTGYTKSGSDARPTLCVAVQWPEERRIAGKGKTKSLIIQVRGPPDDLVSPSCVLEFSQGSY
jgi:hypothetical protein